MSSHAPKLYLKGLPGNMRLPEKLWCNVGCISACCECVLLPLVNKKKKTDLVNSQAEQSQAGNPSKDRGKKGEVWETPAVSGEARCEVTSHEPRGKI